MLFNKKKTFDFENYLVLENFFVKYTCANLQLYSEKSFFLFIEDNIYKQSQNTN